MFVTVDCVYHISISMEYISRMPDRGDMYFMRTYLYCDRSDWEIKHRKTG